MHHNFLDEYSGLDTWLHEIDPRVKTVAFFAIVIATMLVPFSNATPLFFYGFLVLFFLVSSRLPAKFVVMRVLGILPFVFVLALSFFLYGSANRFSLLGYIMVKAVLAVLCMILLVSTTHFVDLLKGFEKLRCPVLIIMVFSFMYRYVYLFIDELMKINQAREARSVGARPWLKIRTLANMVGHLLIRSYERGEGVYLAMCSRGYEGKSRSAHELSQKKIDVIFAVSVSVYLILAQAAAKIL